ncbi:Crotonobetaine/carnitine--CoA ligase [Sinobacterium norvegicum]|uniref:Crotonobetaine/carnitine--CoA ligase n=2 Tax=Sinobacterium norvegicum TaxID=1641715 RepID=A0ABM9AG08_9GAMM|nr:Crotonobetaine/carnitine--CoA ligase [Sinobacterium norvegicum]
MTTVTREQTQQKLNKLSAATMAHTPLQRYTVADRLEQQAVTFADRPFLIEGNVCLTYAEVNARVNQLANAAQQCGLIAGDVAAVMMDNRIEFFLVWLGLAKLGVTAALLNTNVTGKALAHAFEATDAKALFIGDECLAALSSVELQPGQLSLHRIAAKPVQTLAKDHELTDFLALADSACRDNLPALLRQSIVGETSVFYVFTSGTTGLPKAAKVSHMKWLGVGDGMRDMLEYDSNDVFYCVLPLYHGAAGMSLTSTALASGSSIVVRRRFSVSQFWPEVRKYNVTVCQYIGEICRYLINQAPSEDDKHHNLRKMMGAGLGADMWQAFTERFGIEHIYEGWSATEANTSLINVDNKIGSCGRLPFADKTNAQLVKYDVEADDYCRDSNGFMIPCQPGETGEMIGMILDIPNVGAGRFEGYTSAEATNKKILRGVFSEGDSWWSSGDLLRRDADGYYYFIDRIGDTYRWKSENVSTQEVSQALADFSGLEMLNIYGVRVPGQEGRAGMAAVVMQPGVDFEPRRFYQLTEQRLPRYAAPLFVRLSQQADMTATFKLRKVDLQRQGYSAESIDEPLFVRDDHSATYQPLTTAVLEQLQIAVFEA